MKKIEIFQVDAFTDRLFSGNPAAVCLLDEWLSDELMQSIAAENNLAETAFVKTSLQHNEIRWFTPTMEVDLCGHATLASAFVQFNTPGFSGKEISYHSPRSGLLKVMKKDGLLYLDFPSDEFKPVLPESVPASACIGQECKEIYLGKSDYIFVLNNEEEILKLQLNMTEISRLNARGLVVTAPGKNCDFVSRFFAPQSGIPEDPVTGSAHTSLIPLWSEKTGKLKMSARQLSARGGFLHCEYHGERCLIGGNAILYMTGKIELP